MPVPGWIEIDAVLARERLDLRVLRQIFWRSILDVVIDGEDWLCRIGNRRRADLLKFRNHRTGIVVRHHMTRANRNEIAAAHLRPEQAHPRGALQSSQPGSDPYPLISATNKLLANVILTHAKNL